MDYNPIEKILNYFDEVGEVQFCQDIKNHELPQEIEEALKYTGYIAKFSALADCLPIIVIVKD